MDKEIGAFELHHLIADASYKKGVERSKERIDILECAVQELMEFVVKYSDVVDGEDGQPEPNYAMSLVTMAQDVLEERHD